MHIQVIDRRLGAQDCIHVLTFYSFAANELELGNGGECEAKKQLRAVFDLELQGGTIPEALILLNETLLSTGSEWISRTKRRVLASAFLN
jgi:hypothetical protein